MSEVENQAPSNMLAVIERVAANPDVDPQKMLALLELQERMMARQAEINFNQALAELPAFRVKKNGRVDLGNGRSYPFSRWEDIDEVIRPHLIGNGFTLGFTTTDRQGDGGGMVVTGTLRHRDGHSVSATMALPLDTGPGRNNLQARGSSLSYGRRYVAEMLLNIVREGDDDDGVAGGDEPITDQQVAELSREMTASNFSERAMFDLLGVTKLGDVRKSQLAIARNAISMRRRQRGQT